MVSKKLPVKLPHRPLTNIDLIKYVKKLSIPKFRGVFMRNALPKKIHTHECGIINLDDKQGPGTHWTGYIKSKTKILYFDSIGHLQPPLEVEKYFNSDGSNIILYNQKRFQNLNTYNCGHLCLKFLYFNAK